MKTLVTTLIIILTLALLFWNAVDVFAMGNTFNVNGTEYANPYDVVCFDPLMTSVVLLNDCDGNMQEKPKTDKPETVVIIEPETVEPETVATVEPEIVEPEIIEPETVEPDTCKNKNSGKDGTPNECNAGIGQEKNGG